MTDTPAPEWLPPRAPDAEDPPTYAAPAEPARGFVQPTPAEKRQREYEAALARDRPRPVIPLPPGLPSTPATAPAAPRVSGPAPSPPAEIPPQSGPTFARAPARGAGSSPWRKRNPVATSALMLSILSIFLLLASFGRAFLLSVPLSGIAWYMATLGRRPIVTGETESGRTEVQIARWLALIGIGLALVAMITWVILELNGFGVDDLEREIRELTREDRPRRGD